MTTIEEIALNRMRQKERVALEGVYGFWNFRLSYSLLSILLFWVFEGETS